MGAQQSPNTDPDVKSRPRKLSSSTQEEIALRAARDKSAALKKVVSAWEKQQDEERKLRRTYANWLLLALFSQMALVNFAFFAIGLGFFSVDEWTARTFIMAVFSEIAGMVYCIVRYLFSKTGVEIFELVKKL